MKTKLFPSFLLAVIVAIALPAQAVKTLEVLNAGAHAESDNLSAWGPVFDGNLNTGINSVEGGEIRCNLAALADSSHEVYVSRVLVTHEGNHYYSLYTSEDGQTWTPVRNATHVGHEGVKTTATYYIASSVNWFKYVFDSANGETGLWELEFWGYTVKKPENVVLNKSNLAKMYNPDGTMTANNGTGGFGGGSGLSWLFNGGKKTDGSWVTGITYMSGIGNGGWCLIDFTGDQSMPAGGYFVTSIAITQGFDFKYSLYWSMDGSAWNPVDDAIGVSKVGTATYDVNETAKYVKVLLNETGGWTGNLSEIEVFAVDPDEIGCTHPSYTEWTEVEGTATCLLPGLDERYCTICGARFTREQENALGHDYMSHLLKPGKYRQFGSGYVDCTRCGWRLDFPEDENDPFATMPLDLVTNRVDGTPIGRVSVKGQYNFTEITVTTTGNGADEPNPNNNWGVNPSALINNLWTWTWHDYWYSMSSDLNPHVDYIFGTEIDLAWIEISVKNHTHFVRLYSVDDATDEETQLEDFQIVRTDIETGNQYHIWRAPGSDPFVDIYKKDGEPLKFDELPVVADSGIPARKHDENGNEIPDDPTTPKDDEGSNDNNQYQRFTLRFYEQPIKHLRVRQMTMSGGTMVTMKPMYISELRPWGTVRGASDLPYRKETLMILR